MNYDRIFDSTTGQLVNAIYNLTGFYLSHFFNNQAKDVKEHIEENWMV